MIELRTPRLLLRRARPEGLQALHAVLKTGDGIGFSVADEGQSAEPRTPYRPRFSGFSRRQNRLVFELRDELVDSGGSEDEDECRNA